jgi:hypothetical protein
MPRTDRSITILTGMIIAALYVILLVAFTQESYMRRDAAGRADSFHGQAAIHDVSKRVCRVEPPLCAELFPNVGDRQSCAASIDAVRRYLTDPMMPLTLDGLRRAMRHEHAEIGP